MPRIHRTERVIWITPCAALLWATMQGCAPVQVAMAPGEDYVFPTTLDERLSAESRREIETAWREVLRGSALSAEKRFQRLAHSNPDSPAPQTGLAYARLRGRRLDSAAMTFAAVLARYPDHVPALIGAGSTAVRLKRPEQALEFYRRAWALEGASASRTSRLIRQRLTELKMAITERRVTAARAALQAGQTGSARDEYRAALDAAPELGEVRVALADLIAGEGDVRAAVDLLEQAPTDDLQVLSRLGEMRSQLGDYAAAFAVYQRALARNPQDAEIQRRMEEAQRAIELQSMPEEYRQIYAAVRVTRADLAALLSVKLTALARREPGQPSVATDISGSWAKDHVIRILSYGILDVYPNHTFQPAAIVRRAELARAVARVLDLFNLPSQPGPVISDMSSANLYHRDASRAVAAGLLDLTRTGAFEPWRPVTGGDAVAVIEALARIVGG